MPILNFDLLKKILVPHVLSINHNLLLCCVIMDYLKFEASSTQSNNDKICKERQNFTLNVSQTLFIAEMWISALNIVISLKKVAWINRPSPESNPLKVNRRFAQNPNATRAHERTSRRNLICSRFVTFRPIVINMNLCDTAKPVSEFPDANWICVGFSDFFETVFRARLAWPENIRVYDCERRQEM